MKHSEMCDEDMVVFDKEWVSKSRWRYHYTCPVCGATREREIQGGVIYSNVITSDWREKRRRGRTEKITDEYVEGDMSERALERSLNRVYGLDES